MHNFKLLGIMVLLVITIALEPTINVTAQRLSNQVRAIQRSKWLDDATLDRLHLEALSARAASISARERPATSPDPVPAPDLAPGAPRVDPSADEEDFASQSVVSKTMADNDRIVFPDELQDAKAKAAEAAAKSGAGDSNSVETPEEITAPKISLRNMIQVPNNCPEGYEMDANGVCREVF